ncbi:hypothetical protein IJM86_01980 [bacterium]|nr:hypothetical protein [bacterium]
MYLELKETIETIRQKEALKHKGDEIWEALMNGKHNPQKITADEIRWINQENY